MEPPRVLVFAGPNGSGKSSATQYVAPIGQYINADEIQKENGCSAMEAAKLAEEAREFCLKHRYSFTFETVLSTERNLLLLERARDSGYEPMALYFVTRTPTINQRRVQKRVEAGGNFVEPSKIVPRYLRAMKLIPRLCAVCDRTLIYDNSGERGVYTPQLIAKVVKGEVFIYPSEFWSESDILALLSGKYVPEGF